MPSSAVSLAAPLPNPAHAQRATLRSRSAALLPGFAPGSLLRTLQGETPIETLGAGSVAIDSHGRLHSLRARIALRVERALMVRILPGALDLRARLDRDLLVGAGQELMMEDWRTRLLHAGPAPVPARQLCDDALILGRVLGHVTLHVPVTDVPVVLLVNGLAVLSCGRDRAARLTRQGRGGASA